MKFSLGLYHDQDTGRTRWAVLGPTSTWYFPTTYGRLAAMRLCEQLNRSVA